MDTGTSPGGDEAVHEQALLRLMAGRQKKLEEEEDEQD